MRTAAALATLLLVALILRLWDLTERTPFLFDDAYNWLESRNLYDGAGRPLAYARPAWTVAGAAAMAVVGPRPWALALVSGLAGTATVAAVWWVARGLWPAAPRSGLLALAAAAALAISPLHVLYSREALADAAALLPATVLVGLWWRGRALTAGLAWGLAGLLNDRWWLVGALLLVAFEFVAPRPGRWRRGALIAAGAAACATAAALADPGRAGYAAQIADRYGKAGAIDWHLDDVLIYPYLLWRYLGAGLLAVAIAGGAVAVAAARRSPADRVVLAWAVVPLVAFTATLPNLRYATVVLPALALLSGRAVAAVAGAARPDLVSGAGAVTAVTAAVAAVAIGTSAARTVAGVGPPPCGYAEANRLAVSPHFSTSQYADEVVAGVGRAAPPPSAGRGPAADLLVDWSAPLQGQGAAAARLAYLAARTAVAPDAVVDNPCGASRQTAWETALGGWRGGRAFERAHRSGLGAPGQIRLYRAAGAPPATVLP